MAAHVSIDTVHEIKIDAKNKEENRFPHLVEVDI